MRGSLSSAGGHTRGSCFCDESSKRYRNIERIARRKLLLLDVATTLEDLGLKGDRKGQYSIRVNDQYRICFVWKAPDAFHVQIVDYH